MACKPGTPPLPGEEIDRLLVEVPDWSVEEAEGHLRLTTHAAAGLTDNDFILAARLDKVV